MSFPELRDLEELAGVTARAPFAVVYFWADWAQPCKQMDLVFSEVAQECPQAQYYRVEAEKVSDASEKYEISVVPTFLFFKNGELASKLEGADAPGLVKLVREGTRGAAAAPAAKQPTAAAAASAEPFTLTPALRSRLEALVSSAPMMLFMKGTPDEPKCGFSRRIVALLRDAGASFQSFDILGDEQVRQGLKAMNNWPTYPQLYVCGRLLGGIDICEQLRDDGDLADALQPAADANKALQQRLTTLLSQAPVMLFMKGSPDEPKCGFSRRIVELLRRHNVAFGSFDILSDEQVRQGLKTMSNWPTYPQLYAKGKLIGGVDIAEELAEQGELTEALQ